MADGIAKISRRSTRLFVGEQEAMETGNVGAAMIVYETRNNSIQDEKEREKDKQWDARSSSHDSMKDSVFKPIFDVGRNLDGMFPSTREAIDNQVAKSLMAAKALEKEKHEGRPLNFGVVLPKSIYRSSFPQVEDYGYLESLGLKSIVTLVKKDYPPGFEAFMKKNDIKHHVIDMQGTKKVDIPESVMKSIMRICLDKENHPLLIHCNHGKHRTGCAAAVIRHLSGWNVQSIVEEYTAFSEPKVRECDVKYIKEYKISSLNGLFNTSVDHTPTTPVRSKARMGRVVAITLLAIGIWFTLLNFWDRG